MPRQQRYERAQYVQVQYSPRVHPRNGKQNPAERSEDRNARRELCVAVGAARAGPYNHEALYVYNSESTADEKDDNGYGAISYGFTRDASVVKSKNDVRTAHTL